MKKAITYITTAFSCIGAITMIFLILTAITDLDYLEIGVLSLAAGSMIGLFMNLGVLE